MSESTAEPETLPVAAPETESTPSEPPAPEPGPVGRKPEEFFSFDDHGKTRYADPMVVHRRILQAAAGEDIYTKINSFESEARGLAYDAAEFLAKVAREAFNLKPFDEETGEGWTETSSIYLLYDMLEWSQKKSSNGEVTAN